MVWSSLAIFEEGEGDPTATIGKIIYIDLPTTEQICRKIKAPLTVA